MYSLVQLRQLHGTCNCSFVVSFWMDLYTRGLVVLMITRIRRLLPRVSAAITR
jgi:hypothetical protein